MMIPNDQELDFLFAGSAEQVDAFLEQHGDEFSKSDRTEFSHAAREESLAATRSNVFAWVFAITIDWREEDDEIVRLFGKRLPGKLAAEFTDKGLTVSYNEAVYEIPLSFSPADRYITIRGVAKIIEDGYEIRLMNDSYYSDTHAFILLPHASWQRLEQRYGKEQVDEVFRKITDTLDFP
ncbi:hypothetical protein [Paenibacillus sp. GCM10027626]|uniref:hypothetical protein n=1 Tax=Paenibacillus sp. GCM10027626 TaxID=3273411 RepID=UPI00363736A4